MVWSEGIVVGQRKERFSGLSTFNVNSNAEAKGTEEVQQIIRVSSQ